MKVRIFEKKDLDPYKTLGIKKGASKSEVKSAYLRLAKRFHPDRNKDKNAEEKFKDVLWSYLALRDGEYKGPNSSTLPVDWEDYEWEKDFAQNFGNEEVSYDESSIKLIGNTGRIFAKVWVDIVDAGGYVVFDAFDFEGHKVRRLSLEYVDDELDIKYPLTYVWDSSRGNGFWKRKK